MTAHTHRTLVEGCYRCDLNRDEIERADLDACRKCRGYGEDSHGIACDACNGSGSQSVAESQR